MLASHAPAHIVCVYYFRLASKKRKQMTTFESGSDWVMCCASLFCKHMRFIRVVVNYVERVTIAIVSLLNCTVDSIVWVAVDNFIFGRECTLNYCMCVCVCVAWILVQCCGLQWATSHFVGLAWWCKHGSLKWCVSLQESHTGVITGAIPYDSNTSSLCRAYTSFAIIKRYVSFLPARLHTCCYPCTL